MQWFVYFQSDSKQSANLLQAQKNGGGRSRAPQNDYGDRAFSQQSFTQSQGQLPQAQIQAAPTGGEDPYAACKATPQMFSIEPCADTF